MFGINDRAQLAEAERHFQKRRRAAAMAGGATLIAPETVFFAHDTQIGRDVSIEPNVVFGPGVSVADNVTIRAFSHIEGARIASGADHRAVRAAAARCARSARTPISAISSRSRTPSVEEGAKINHLAYVGDARVGAKANVGAGTITCNYDGVNKHHTDIGSDAFIGSNSALVAPVTIGDGAYVGSGSVITEDVRGRCARHRPRAAGQQAGQGGRSAEEGLSRNQHLASILVIF